MTDRELKKARFLALIAQLTAELGSERQASILAGCDPSYPGKLREEDRRFVGLDQIEKTQTKLGLDERFFSDASLGESPPYKRHLKSNQSETRLERDQAHYPIVLAYFDELRRLKTPAHEKDEEVVLGIRFADGGASLTLEKVKAYHRLERDAREDRERAAARGESVERVLPPLPEGGKRVLPLKSKK